MIRQYLVTDAIGQLGHAIVRKLVEQKRWVRVLVDPDADTTPLHGLPVEVSYGSVLNKDSMKEFFAVVDPRETVVIHTAEMVSIADIRNPSIHRMNVQGTVAVADMCVRYRIGKLVYVSSAHAIPQPQGSGCVEEVEHFNRHLVEGEYAKSKAEATQYILDRVKLNKLNAVIVNPSGIIGPYDYSNSEITQLISDYLAGNLTKVIQGGYDFADVRDVADGVLSAVDRGNMGTCYILSNQYVSAKEFVERLNDVSGKKPVKLFLPIWVAKRIAPIANMYYKVRRVPSPYTKYSLFSVYPKTRYNHSKADSELEYKPRELSDSLADTVSWIEERERLNMQSAE